jgi:hypothetical protein
MSKCLWKSRLQVCSAGSFSKPLLALIFTSRGLFNKKPDHRIILSALQKGTNLGATLPPAVQGFVTIQNAENSETPGEEASSWFWMETSGARNDSTNDKDRRSDMCPPIPMAPLYRGWSDSVTAHGLFITFGYILISCACPL